MSKKILCDGCKNIIEDKKYLSCGGCKQYYDLVCANIPEQRFINTMTEEHKEAWRCVGCKSKQPKADNTNTPVRSSFEGVTMHRGAAGKSPVYLDISLYEQHNLNDTTIPSESENEDLHHELKKEILKLKWELDSANHKITQLSIENEDLKKTITELKSINDKTSLKKRSSPKQAKKSFSNNKQAEKKLAENENIVEKENNNNGEQKQQEKNRKITKCAKKICMISSNKTNSMLSIAESTFDNYKICHYLKPNSGINQLIKGLEVKLKGYTQKDCCIIFIGQEDFKKTNNYFDLVLNLRETLQLITHTNIIICLPTFVCNNHSTIFNWRLECFNNLLYLDIHTHNYAYLLDSNLNLSYDYDMFSRRYGTIKNKGMKKIFEDLEQLVLFLVSNENDSSDEINTVTCSDFFRN